MLVAIVARFAILLAILYNCDAFKVLLVFPVPGKSHSILGEGYVRHLLSAGHEVTYLTPILIKNPPARLRQIDLSENFKYLSEDIFDVNRFMYKELNMQDELKYMVIFDNLLNNTLRMDVVQKFIKDRSVKFDVVIVDWLYTELGVGFSSVFNCPLIWFSSMDVHTTVLALIDDYLNPAYARHHMSTEYSSSFLNRVKELWTISRTWLYHWWHLDEKERMFREIFGPASEERGIKLPHFNDVRYNASLMLGNSHIVVGEAIALPQNYWHIGGYHIKKTVEPLPKDLQKIMDTAKDGVIYFSLGSLLKGRKIPSAVKKRFLNIFSELKQEIIWKFDEQMTDLPKNVHIVTWAPQQSILAHPNCVLFITHGGLLSTLETIKYGVPIIGIPFFADQYLNVNKVVAKGVGRRVDISENTPEELRFAIREMMANSSYRTRVKELSSLFIADSDPGQRLVQGVELVVRTKGAPHLRSVALRVPFYQKLYLDLLLLVIGIVFGIIVLISYTCKYLRTFISRSNQGKKKLN
ncbi:UDP-glucosyltransferase 2-like isoform X1 [Danaus plexippus]|uniref:UDP-glucosyltransferase 2-like isoform X1 n=2 Tax=Danaus plexippus TaxID=13037 RepID=UPI002AAF8AD6|nr:UDP-glucosyltransferase 2-like isoform X1 [Danaus plexippus]